MNEKEAIIMRYGGVSLVAELMGCSRPTVTKALRGDYNPKCEKERELAERIRKCALNHGGYRVKIK